LQVAFDLTFATFFYISEIWKLLRSGREMETATSHRFHSKHADCWPSTLCLEFMSLVASDQWGVGMILATSQVTGEQTPLYIALATATNGCRGCWNHVFCEWSQLATGLWATIPIHRAKSAQQGSLPCSLPNLRSAGQSGSYTLHLQRQTDCTWIFLWQNLKNLDDLLSHLEWWQHHNTLGAEEVKEMVRTW
jgi:hypothetical protein